MWNYAAERGTENVRSAVFYLGDLSVKVGQTQFVSWQDWGGFLKKPQLIRDNRCFPHMAMV